LTNHVINLYVLKHAV